MLKHDRATLENKATGKKIAEDLPPKDRFTVARPLLL